MVKTCLQALAAQFDNEHVKIDTKVFNPARIWKFYGTLSMKGDATPEGILGLAGNVAEWVSDGWAMALPGGTDPRGPTSSTLRVVRGGSFADDDDRLRASVRAGYPPSTAHVTIGFRCAQDL